uniref:Uncharacterized protein n=1 Tax=Cucumis melo TaxID=3656 RepID=A0A9I9E9Y9_CUCME
MYPKQIPLMIQALYLQLDSEKRHIIKMSIQHKCPCYGLYNKMLDGIDTFAGGKGKVLWSCGSSSQVLYEGSSQPLALRVVRLVYDEIYMDHLTSRPDKQNELNQLQ